MPADDASANENGTDHDARRAASSGPSGPRRLTLNSAVRRRRADRAFYIRLAGAIRQNEAALRRLSQ